MKALLNRTGGDGLTEEMLKKYISLYHGAVFRLAYSYLKNRADAEDVCEEAFIKLYLYDGSFETDENCRAWLMKVTVNLSKNMLKSCWFSRREELDESTPAQVCEDYGLAQPMKKLPPKYRLVIHLYYYEGYTAKEISEITGTPVSTVTTQMSRARAQLKKIIEKENLL